MIVSSYQFSIGIFADGRLFCFSNEYVAFSENIVVIPGMWQHIRLSNFRGLFQRTPSFFLKVDGESVNFNGHHVTESKRPSRPSEKHKWIFGAEQISTGGFENQLGGYLADIRLWNRTSRVKNLPLGRGNLENVEKLVFRFLLDETSREAKQIYRSNEGVLHFNNKGLLVGNAKMDPSFISSHNEDEMVVPEPQSVQLVESTSGTSEAFTGLQLAQVAESIGSQLKRISESFTSYSSLDAAHLFSISIQPRRLNFLILDSIIEQCLRMARQTEIALSILSTTIKLLQRNLEHVVTSEVKPATLGLSSGTSSNETNLAIKLKKRLFAVIDTSCRLRVNGSLVENAISCICAGISIFYESQELKQELLVGLMNHGTYFSDGSVIPALASVRHKLLTFLWGLEWVQNFIGGSNPSQILRWPSNFMTAAAGALKVKRVHIRVSKTELIKYLNVVAPAEFLEDYCSLDSYSTQELKTIYGDLEEAVKAKTVVLKKDNNPSDGDTSEQDNVVEISMKYIFRQFDPESIGFLSKLQIALAPELRQKQLETNDMDDIEEQIDSYLKRKILGHFDSTEPKVPESKSSGFDWNPTADDAGLNSAFSFDTKASSSNLIISNSGFIVKHRSKVAWAIAITDKGYTKNSGIHEWRFKIQKCNSKGHLFFGLASRLGDIDSYLGNDRYSFGVLLTGDIYYDAQARKRNVFPSDTYSSGCTIQIAYDTSKNSLSFVSVDDSGGTGEPYLVVVPDLFEFDSVVYPAVCLREGSDIVELQGFKNDTRVTSHGLFSDTSMSFNARFAKYYRLLLTSIQQNRRSLTHLSLRDVLASATAYVLMWSEYDYEWSIQARLAVLEILLELKDEETTRLHLLLGVLLGKISSVLIAVEVPSKINGLVDCHLLSNGLSCDGCLLSRSINRQLRVGHGANSRIHPMLEFKAGSARYQVLCEWISRSLAATPSLRLVRNNKHLEKASLHLIGGMIYHSKIEIEELAVMLDQSQRSKTNFWESIAATRPNTSLIDIWKTSYEFVGWLAQKSNGPDYIIELSQLLFDLEPCASHPQDHLGSLLVTLRSALDLDHVGEGRPRSRLRLFRNASKSTLSIPFMVVQLLRTIVEQSYSIMQVHELLLSQDACARKRQIGFQTLTDTLSRIPLSTMSMPVLSAVLVVVPGALRHWRTYDNAVLWHYLSGLEACGIAEKDALIGAFRKFGESISKLLQACALVGGTSARGLQLALLDTLGLRIRYVDHELLSRTGILEDLHRLIDCSRDSIHETIRTGEGASVASVQLIGRAAMKVFYLLCSQVVLPLDSLVPSIDVTSMSISRTASLPGKPEQNLASSVFSILFKELQLVIDDQAFDEDVFVDSNQKNNEMFKVKSNQHVEEITALLVSMSLSMNCRSLLLTEQWLSLLASLATLTSGRTRSNVFLLFRQVLPGLDPKMVRISYRDQRLDLAAFFIEIIAGSLASPQINHVAAASETIHLLRCLITSASWCDMLIAHLSCDELPRLIAALSVLSGDMSVLYPGGCVKVFHPASSSGYLEATVVSDYEERKTTSKFNGVPVLLNDKVYVVEEQLVHAVIDFEDYDYSRMFDTILQSFEKFHCDWDSPIHFIVSHEEVSIMMDIQSETAIGTLQKNSMITCQSKSGKRILLDKHSCEIHDVPCGWVDTANLKVQPVTRQEILRKLAYSHAFTCLTNCLGHSVLKSLPPNVFISIVKLAIKDDTGTFTLPTLSMLNEKISYILHRLGSNAEQIHGVQENPVVVVDIAEEKTEANRDSVSSIVAMGFPRAWAIRALKENNGDITEAVSWICVKGGSIDMGDSDEQDDESLEAPSIDFSNTEIGGDADFLEMDIQGIDISFLDNKKRYPDYSLDNVNFSGDAGAEALNLSQSVWGDSFRSAFVESIIGIEDDALKVQLENLLYVKCQLQARKTVLKLLSLTRSCVEEYIKLHQIDEYVTMHLTEVVCHEAFVAYPFYGFSILREISGDAVSIPQASKAFVCHAISSSPAVATHLLDWVEKALKTICSGPNANAKLFAAQWVSRILISDSKICNKLVEVWCKVIRSPYVPIKIEGMAILCDLLCCKPTELSCIPFIRLSRLTQQHLLSDVVDDATYYTRYCKTLVKLYSKLVEIEKSIGKVPYALELGQGLVALHVSDGSTLGSYGSEWEISFHLQADDVKGRSVLVQGVSPTSLKILASSDDGFIGLQTNGREISFGAKLDRGKDVSISLVCHSYANSSHNSSASSPAFIEEPDADWERIERSERSTSMDDEDSEYFTHLVQSQGHKSKTTNEMSIVKLYVNSRLAGTVVLSKPEAKLQLDILGSTTEESFQGKIYSCKSKNLLFDMSQQDPGSVIVSSKNLVCAGFLTKGAKLVPIETAITKTAENHESRPTFNDSSSIVGRDKCPSWPTIEPDCMVDPDCMTARMDILNNGICSAGVFSWTLDDSNATLVPVEFQTACHTFRIKLFSKCLEKNLTQLEGSITLTNQDCFGICLIIGSFDLLSGVLEFHCSKVVEGENRFKSFLKNLRFHGVEKNGEICGSWSSKAELRSYGSEMLNMHFSGYFSPCWFEFCESGCDFKILKNECISLKHQLSFSNLLDFPNPPRGYQVLIIDFTPYPHGFSLIEESHPEPVECLTWACPACTFINDADSVCCAICNSPNPKPVKSDTAVGSDNMSYFSGVGGIHPDTGIYFWEIQVRRLEGNFSIGLGSHGLCLNQPIGSDEFGWGFQFDSCTENNPDHFDEIQLGDTFGFLLDADLKRFQLFVNRVLRYEWFKEDGFLTSPVSACIGFEFEELNSDSSPLILSGLAEGEVVLLSKENTEYFRGNFLNGRPHGMCSETLIEGETTTQVWQHGKRGDSGTEDFVEPVVSMNGMVSGSMNFSVVSQILLDPSACGSAISVSPDCLTAEFTGGHSTRSVVLGTAGFTEGVHYWEVNIQGLQWGSVYVGIATRNTASRMKFQGWGEGYGFVNYRATHGPGGERLYGSFYETGDTVGVMLDMDRGRLHFFKTGAKTAAVDLGLAYSGIDRNICFYPCFGLSKPRDKVTLKNTHSLSCYLESPNDRLADYASTLHSLQNWTASNNILRDEAYSLLSHSHLGDLKSLGGMMIEINTDDSLCQALCAPELKLVPGDVVKGDRGEATVLGSHRHCIWYLLEGADFPMFWSREEFATLAKETKLLKISSDSKNRELGLSKMSREAFDIAAASMWTIAQDGLLVEVVNRACDRVSCDFCSLTLDDIMLQLKLASKTSEYHYRPLVLKTESEISVRFAILACINIRISRLLPLIEFDRENKGEGFNVRYHSASPTNVAGDDQVVQLLRLITFTRVKLAAWTDMLILSSTPTIPASDEYDWPPELPMIKVNRIRAGDHRLATLPIEERFKSSVFGQLMVEMNDWPLTRFRRSYRHIQDISQQRSFYVKFEGEGVDDHGGPYRAVFQIALEEEAGGSLELLVPCANAAEGAMQNTDVVILNVNNPRISQLRFLGRLLGVAIRHHINMGLKLPGMIWGPLARESIGWKELDEVDSFTARSLQRIEMLSKQEWDTAKEIWSELLINKLEPGTLQANGLAEKDIDGNIYLPYECRIRAIDLVVEQYLLQSKPWFQELARGMADCLPSHFFEMFTRQELEELVCGSPEIDIELLKQATVYEGIDPEAPFVGYFWASLETMNQEERAKFINFVCARSRLPSSLDKFPMNFKIMPAVRNDDAQLPHSQTCFFSLNLPEYSSKEVCLQKLIYASNNCNTMEDFDDHDAAGFEGM